VDAIHQLKKEAKHWRKEVRRSNPGPVRRLKLAYPGAPEAPVLRDIQHALARERGYDSWKALLTAMAAAPASPGALAASGGDDQPPARETHAGRVAQFLDLACWDHQSSGRGLYATRHAAALRLVQKHPEIAGESLETAIVCGEIDRVERILADDPAQANRKFGPRRWEPLLYLCYARLDTPAARDHALAIARRLLDAGADPNAYYPAGDAVYSALVGVAGEGEQDAFPHPHREELYRLLLERGAEPYDHQVEYNTHFRGSVLWWLEITHAHTVQSGRAGDWNDPGWPMFDMFMYGNGARFLYWVAIERNDPALARWLADHGANPNAAPAKDRRFSKRSLYEEALLRGRDEIADILRRAGAVVQPEAFTGEDAFVLACLQLDRTAAADAAARHPEYLASPRAVRAAIDGDRDDVVALLLDFGLTVDLQDEHGERPLHTAAGRDARKVAALLIERGAEIDPVEKRWQATPIGFASHSGHLAMIDLLSAHSRDVWHLTYHGKVDRLAEVLVAEPQRARETNDIGVGPLWWLPLDEGLALRVAELLVAHGADAAQKARDGRTAIDLARDRGLDRVAELLSTLAR
jgi:ankyrin repeat protein